MISKPTPTELVNLYQQSAYKSTVLELEAELRAWLSKTGDQDFGAPISDDFRAEDKRKLGELMQRRARVNNASE